MREELREANQQEADERIYIIHHNLYEPILAGIENGGNSALKLINRSIYIGLRSAFIVFYRRVQLAVGISLREREREFDYNKDESWARHMSQH